MSAQREGPVPQKININYYAVKDWAMHTRCGNNQTESPLCSEYLALS